MEWSTLRNIGMVIASPRKTLMQNASLKTLLSLSISNEIRPLLVVPRARRVDSPRNARPRFDGPRQVKVARTMTGWLRTRSDSSLQRNPSARREVPRRDCLAEPDDEVSVGIATDEEDSVHVSSRGKARPPGEVDSSRGDRPHSV